MRWVRIWPSHLERLWAVEFLGFERPARCDAYDRATHEVCTVRPATDKWTADRRADRTRYLAPTSGAAQRVRGPQDRATTPSRHGKASMKILVGAASGYIDGFDRVL